jgi:PAS domain S-box-containing protein
MGTWNIQRLVLAGFLSAVCVLAALVTIVGSGLSRTQELSSAQKDSHYILLAAQKIDAAMALAIAAHRGHVISASPEFLLQRDAALEALRVELDKLDELAQGDLERQVLAVELRKLAQQRLATFTPAGKALAAPASADLAENGAEWRETLSQLTGQERHQLRMAAEEKQAHVRWTGTAMVMLLACLALFLVLLYALIRRSIARDETRRALKKSEALLRQILEVLPVGVFVADRDGKLQMINPAAHAIWGTRPDADTPPACRAWRADTGQELGAEDYGMVRALRHGEVMLNQEFEIERADGSRRFLRVSAMPLRDRGHGIAGAITVNMDVTDLKQTELALKAAHDALEARVAMRTRDLAVANEQLTRQIEERRRAEGALRHTQNVLTIAQRVAHVGSWEMDLATREVRWSDEYFRICGLAPGSIEPTMAAGMAMVHVADRERVARVLAEAVEQGTGFSVASRIVWSDGSIRHVLGQGETVEVEGNRRLIGSLLDITEQVQQQESLRQLAAHLETVKEAERKRIAREIHDEMGQNLLALRIDVSMLHARTAHAHPRLHKKVETVLANVDHTIKSVRAVINNLRPGVLDLGLFASIQWQVQEFSRRNNIVYKLMANADDIDGGLSEEQTIALFRILQESLTNVARHAKASKVEITLQRDADRIWMTIADDGVGIYPGERRKSNSFGLIGMRERIAALGGELHIDSASGAGTVLTLSIPLDEVPTPQRAQA